MVLRSWQFLVLFPLCPNGVCLHSTAVCLSTKHGRPVDPLKALAQLCLAGILGLLTQAECRLCMTKDASLAHAWCPAMQVRLAACHAARALLSSCTDSFREQLLPLLLPQLCFNRWHESDGVRLYSQATWQQALQGNGPLWLARCLPQVCALPLCFRVPHTQHCRPIRQTKSKLICGNSKTEADSLSKLWMNGSPEIVVDACRPPSTFPPTPAPVLKRGSPQSLLA